jgi:hypothetical protein
LGKFLGCQIPLEGKNFCQNDLICEEKLAPAVSTIAVKATR